MSKHLVIKLYKLAKQQLLKEFLESVK